MSEEKKIPEENKPDDEKSYIVDHETESAIVINNEGRAKIIQKEHVHGEAASEGCLIINAMAWKMQQPGVINDIVKEFIESTKKPEEDKNEG